MVKPWVRPLRRGPRFVRDIRELVELVPDGSRVSVGGFHFTRQPVRLVEALVDRGAKRLTHVQWGGSIGLEILLEADAVDHLVFCFSSLEIFGIAPNFRRVLESGQVTHEEYTALELHHSLLAAEMNLQELPLQAPLGSWRAKGATDGWLAMSPGIDIDIVLLHAQRADTDGNVEISGSQGLDRTLAFAGRKVLVTVEEVVPCGSLHDRAAVVPRQFIEAIAVVPGGAWPTSCLPHYGPDFAEVARRVRAGRFHRPHDSSQPGEVARRAPVVDWATAKWPEPSGSVLTTADLMVAWLMRQLDDESVCSIGSASSLASVAYLAAKASHAPALTLISFNGGYIDVAFRFASLSFAEAADYASAAGYCGGDDSYRWLYQQSRVTHEVVGAGQIDGAGRTNNGWIDLGGGRQLRLPGQGGMADVANMHRNFILYSARQSPRQLVEAVDWTSASRAVHGDEERARLGYGPGAVRLITDLAAFLLDPVTQRFNLASLHPGVGLEHLRSMTGFAFQVPDLIPETAPPSASELAAIRRVDPFGIRSLEFAPARDRLDAIEAVLAAERDYVQETP